MISSKRSRYLYLIFYTLLALSAAAALASGATPWEQTWHGATERILYNSSAWNPLLDERVPRVLVLVCTGASLALSGAVLQALFHNPLASPSVLGITMGGRLLVTLAFILGWNVTSPFAIPVAAFAGCLLTLLLVYSLSMRHGHIQMGTLILTGIAVSTLLLALQGAITYALRDRWQLMQTLTEWDTGSSADRSWMHVHMQMPLTLIGIIGCYVYRAEINILALGEEEAKNLGVDVAAVRWRLFLCVSLLTGGAIAALGVIAFFGLILPHLVRRLAGPDHTLLIPLNAVAGGASLLSLDVLLRITGLHAFSIGNVSAILGGLFFLFLLTTVRQEKYATEEP